MKELAEKIAWREVADALARLIPAERLDAEATGALRAAAGVGVACSGGADSVAAALLVWGLFPELRTKMALLHFNHRTRPECAEEADFVREMARGLGAEFATGERDVAQTSESAEGISTPQAGRGTWSEAALNVGQRFFAVSGGGRTATNGCPTLEACAQAGLETCGTLNEATLRKARLHFFKTTCAALGLRWLVQGHHADDVAENLLMCLGRGSGTAGLAAPRPLQKFAEQEGTEGEVAFVRPLLSLRKAEILAALRDAGGCWREDASNAGNAHLRNRIRHGVAPAWEQAQGNGVVAGALRSRRLLAEDDAALAAWADALWARMTADNANTNRVDWRGMAGIPPAVQRRVLWKVLAAFAPAATPTAAAMDAFVTALAAGLPFQRSIATETDLFFDGQALCVKRQNRVVLHPPFSPDCIPTIPAQAGPLPLGGILFWGDAGRLAVERITLNAEDFAKILSGQIPPDREVFLNVSGLANFRARTAYAGDAYRPLSAPGRRKLSDMFIDRKIPAETRWTLPVICDAESGAALWVPGLPPAHEFRLRAPGPCLRFTWHPTPIGVP